MSKKAQLTLTEYILKSSLKSEIKVVDLQPLLVELKRIGNNLNQIARIINQQSKTDAPLDRVAVITALSGIERELQRLNDDHKNP